MYFFAFKKYLNDSLENYAQNFQIHFFYIDVTYSLTTHDYTYNTGTSLYKGISNTQNFHM